MFSMLFRTIPKLNAVSSFNVSIAVLLFFLYSQIDVGITISANSNFALISPKFFITTLDS